MAASDISDSDDEGQLLYNSVGYASIEFTSGKNGVTLLANSDGLRSLARLFEHMAARTKHSDHIHLTPAMQLTSASESFAVGRRDDGLLPDGNMPPSAKDLGSGD